MSSLSSSLFPSPPLSLRLLYPRPLLSSSPRGSFSRFFSSLPALFHRFPPPAALPCCIAHTRDTGACEIPLSSCERPSAARRLSRAVRDREKSVDRATETRRRRVAWRDSVSRINGNVIRFRSLAERKRKAAGAYGNVHWCRGLKARSGRREGRKEGGRPPSLSSRPTTSDHLFFADDRAQQRVKVPRSFRRGLSTLRVFVTTSSSSLSSSFSSPRCSNRAIFRRRDSCLRHIRVSECV